MNECQEPEMVRSSCKRLCDKPTLNSTNIYGLILIVYVTLRPFIGDSIGIFALLDNFVPGIFLPALLVLPISIKQQRKFTIAWSFIALLYLLFSYGPRYLPNRGLEVNNQSQHLRVLSYNAGQTFSSYDLVESLVRGSNADVVLFQEITRDFIDGYCSQLNDLYPFQVFGPLQGENQAGMGILSRHPIISSSDFKLAEDGLVSQQRVQINIDEEILVFYNIHLTFPWIRLVEVPILGRLWPVYDNSTLLKEVDSLILLLENESLPIIATGDFNTVDRSNSYRRITNILTDSYYTKGLGLGSTWPASIVPVLNIRPALPLVRVDYIMHSHHFHTASATTLSSNGSDHKPVMVDLFFSDNHSIEQ